jgi:putative restriction endonuclease
MDEYCLPPRAEHDVGASGQIPSMQAVAVSQRGERSANDEFGAGVLGPDRLHNPATLLCRPRVGHPRIYLRRPNEVCSIFTDLTRDSGKKSGIDPSPSLCKSCQGDEMKAVFDTKPTSIYDDEVTRHYQFPRRYLALIERCVGDRIILRRPRADGGNLAYFACASVSHLQEDPADPRMTFAHLRDFMQFDRPVPWVVQGRYWEEELRAIPVQQVGVKLRGRSVRALSDEDFSAILTAGLSRTLAFENLKRLDLPPSSAAEALAVVTSPEPRRVELVLGNRIIRDAAFRGLICGAYDNTCAITGLRLFDCNRNAEVQAAHIWCVADGGPDVVQNGIALSSTVHWLFDRHLIAVGDDHRLIVAQDKVPTEYATVYLRHGELIRLPKSVAEQPHPFYLAKHRAHFYAKNSSRT